MHKDMTKHQDGTVNQRGQRVTPHREALPTHLAASMLLRAGD